MTGFGTFKAKVSRKLRAFPRHGRKIVFTHMPKCAGTSVGSALGRTVHPFSRNILNYRAAFPAGQLLAQKQVTTTGLRDNLPHLQFMLCYQLNRGFRYVGGHYPVSKQVLQAYGDDYQFVTLLREPISRWKSQFVFEAGLPPQSAPASMMQLEDRFNGVISSNLGLLMGAMMASMLTSRYPMSQAEAVNLVAPAQETLGLYAVVGRVDEMEMFQADFEAATQARIKIRRKNQSRDLYRGPKHAQLALMNTFLARADTHAKIAELCTPDSALFQGFAAAK